MRRHWLPVVLLGATLVVACGDRDAENVRDAEENTPATVGPADTPTAQEPDAVPLPPLPPLPNVDTSATRPEGETTRGTGTSRPATPTTRTPATSEGTRPQANAPDADREPGRPAASAAPTRPEFREVEVPAGTALPLELITALSSQTAQVETPVRARLKQSVMVDGVTALPAGTVLVGTVTDVARAGRVQGRSRLTLRFTEAQMDSAREPLRTNPVTYEGEATRGEDASKIGAGAGVGAVVGGIVGGGEGAAKGAAIGGAAGTGVVLATRGREVELAAGTDIAATLASAYEARVPNR